MGKFEISGRQAIRSGRAPVIVLFFPEPTVSDLTAALDEVAERFQIATLDPPDWCFPDSAHWRVLAHFDEKVLESFTPAERELVQAEVGTAPPVILSLTLNLRVIDEACEAANTLVVHLLSKFYGIVDDRCGEDSIWNIEQISRTKQGVRFLDCYR